MQEKENLKQHKAEDKAQKQQERILKKEAKGSGTKTKRREDTQNCYKEARSHTKGICKQCNTNNTKESVAETSSFDTAPI